MTEMIMSELNNSAPAAPVVAAPASAPKPAVNAPAPAAADQKSAAVPPKQQRRQTRKQH